MGNTWQHQALWELQAPLRIKGWLSGKIYGLTMTMTMTMDHDSHGVHGKYGETSPHVKPGDRETLLHYFGETPNILITSNYIQLQIITLSLNISTGMRQKSSEFAALQ